MKVVRSVIRILLAVYLVSIAGFGFFQRSLLYFPSHSYIPLTQAHANSSLKELPVKTQDGLDLKGWYAPATSKPFTIVFFHGNGDSLYTASEIPDPYIAAGYGFLLAEYRGYSGLPGKPTEAGLYADARAYLYALMAQGVRSEDIVLFGHSLGTGVATQMAEEFHVGGLMLLAPFMSIPKAAQVHYPFLPAGLLTLDRYENFKKIGNVHVPVLIVNGARDQVIPPSQGKQLFDLANEPRQFHSFPDHGHNDLFEDFAPVSIDWVNRLGAKN
ncbi:MAG TPA: alpha/beta hydrolase [Terracidiphilus sp.]|jgi:hypothetical protein|nr:alpha/beta hydrolase [Terracidiphilus sp.]